MLELDVQLKFIEHICTPAWLISNFNSRSSANWFTIQQLRLRNLFPIELAIRRISYEKASYLERGKKPVSQHTAQLLIWQLVVLNL